MNNEHIPNNSAMDRAPRITKEEYEAELAEEEGMTLEEFRATWITEIVPCDHKNPKWCALYCDGWMIGSMTWIDPNQAT